MKSNELSPIVGVEGSNSLVQFVFNKGGKGDEGFFYLGL